jgi:aspartyl/asparaginyl beta-hydroxylase (cupin superfamily)
LFGHNLQALVARAGEATAKGRLREAYQLWTEILRLHPGNVDALYNLGKMALDQGDAATAIGMLRAAHEADPKEPLILLQLSNACRLAGDAQGEWDCLQRALAIDAYFMPALLGQGQILERQGKRRAAAALFRNALKIAPPPARCPEWLRAPLAHAQQAVDRHMEELAAHLRDSLGSSREALEAGVLERWDEAVSILSGKSTPYPSVANQLQVPRLPAIPFFNTELFSWVAALEAATDQIREEFLGAMRGHGQDFAPYIQYRDGQPVNQWQELNHSSRWSSYSLWRSGEPVAENLARCPVTAAALTAVEMADIGGLCPNAMYSALAPHTAIPPHHGETNARLVAHLPLIIPDNCLYRVGYERRQWHEGKVLVFDDTIEHEARNDSDLLRVVLIFDVWNPLLSKAERDMVRTATSAMRSFYQQG